MNGEGDCYEAAAHLIFWGGELEHMPDVTLVHGRPILQRPPFAEFGHAWIEVGDMCFDFSMGKRLVMRREEYYALGNIDPSKSIRYTREEARSFLLRFKHFGPWEGPEGQPPAFTPQEVAYRRPGCGWRRVRCKTASRFDNVLERERSNGSEVRIRELEE